MTGGALRLQDARGCLTADGFAALERAPPGGAPADVAAHLAGCDRCQQRWLSRLRAETGPPAGRPRPATRSPWRNLILVLVGLAVLLGGLLVLMAHS